LDRAREQLLARSPRVLAVQCDITVPAQLDELIRGTLGHFGSIDMLINNAGIIEVGPMQEMTLADYRDAFNTHFCGPLHATLAALPVMRAQKGGRIVNITSIGGKVAAPHLLPYTASKFALVGFSEGLRAELARENVFVTTVVPGLFRSGSARHAVFKGRHRREYAWFSTASVLPLVSIDPDRLARRILRAAQHGQAELITPLAASVQARINGLMPGFTSEISALINRWLPSAGGIGNRRAEGVHSQSDDLTPEFVRQRNEEAAQQHNEV
jgi:NAD(P)-dependent dehydrogenase (short-subunit alcohol dehydrogenase family)